MRGFEDSDTNRHECSYTAWWAQPHCTVGKARGRIIESRQRKHQSQVIITLVSQRGNEERPHLWNGQWRACCSAECHYTDWLLTGSPLPKMHRGWGETSLWQEMQRESLELVRRGGIKRKTKLECDALFIPKPLLWFTHFNSVVWDWHTGLIDLGNETDYTEMFGSPWSLKKFKICSQLKWDLDRWFIFYSVSIKKNSTWALEWSGSMQEYPFK